MVGYKALCRDMSSQYGNMEYQLNKWYQTEGELNIRKNGFHFCNTLEDTLFFYSLKNSRFFMIETDGNVIMGDSQNVAQKIRLVEEVQITGKILDNLVKSSFYDVRAEVATYGRSKDLNILVRDKMPDVRIAVAAQKRDEDLNILVYDENYRVRLAVAEQGRQQDLDILIHDENEYVRHAVVEQKRVKSQKLAKRTPWIYPFFFKKLQKNS